MVTQTLTALGRKGFAPNRPSPLSVEGLPSDVLDLLKEFTVFKNAPPSFLKSVATKLRSVRVPPETYIITEGEEAKAMYWLVKGRVCIKSLDGDATYASLNPGTYFGEIGVLFDCPRTANVVSKTNCLILSLNSKDLRAVLQQYPDTEQQMRIEARRRLDHTASWNRRKRKRSWSDPPRFQGRSSASGRVDFGEIKEKLRRISLFRNLPDLIFDRLAETVSIRHYGQSMYIFRQDSVGNDIYFITEGKAEVVDEETGVVKAVLGEGAYFGEMAFLAMEPVRTASVRCTEPVDCLVITGQALTMLCSEFPDVKSEISEVAAWRASHPSSARPPEERTSFFSNSWQIKSLKPPSPPLRPGSPPLPLLPTLTPDRAMSDSPSAGAGHSLLLHPRLRRNTVQRRGSLFNVGALPDPILVQVFQHLTLPTMMRLRQICRRWLDILTSSSRLFTVLDLTPFNKLINDRSIVPITDFVGARPKIVDVSLCFHLTDEGFSYLVNGIGLSRVVEFRLRSVWEVSSLAILDLTVPSIGGDLESVDLSNCRHVNDQTVSRLIGWVVPEFEPDGTPVTNPPPGTVVGCPKLKRLRLGYCKHVTDRSMYHIAAYAADRLEMLDLTRCTSITDTGFSYWSARPFPNLRELILSDCTFLSDSAMAALGSVAPGLEYLNLSFCCTLTDMAVYLICMGCKNLRELDLSFCGSAVSDASLSTISVHLKLLQRLSIRGCVRVTTAGLSAVRMGCPNLKHFDYSQCINVDATPK